MRRAEDTTGSHFLGSRFVFGGAYGMHMELGGVGR
jgi:hypothetical protein